MKKAHRREFADEAQERAYWERPDSGADLDWARAEKVRLPRLKPSTTAISLGCR